MPDTTSTVTVDGVEPSILVKLLNTKENPARVKIYTDDNGGDRYLEKANETPFLVTQADLSVLGGVEIEIVSDTPADSAPESPVVSAPSSAEIVNKLSPVNPSPGQSGQ